MQKLLSRHKAELSAAQQAAADEARRHLDTYVAQNEAAVRQLKERMAREAEEAVEKERASAGVRLREVSERYEQQLQVRRGWRRCEGGTVAGCGARLWGHPGCGLRAVVA